MRRAKNITEDIEPSKFTLYQLATECYQRSDSISAEDRLFVILNLAGYSGAAAYRAAYPTTASAASSAVLASRKLNEPHIQNLLANINENYWSGSVILKTDCFKGKSRRWPKWMPAKKKKLEPPY